MKFYAYLWLRDDGTPYYVGKGSGRRAYSSWNHIAPPPKDRERIVVLFRSTEQEAFEMERELIANWGRKDNGTGCLINLVDGGDGGHAGWSPERRENLSRLKTGNTFAVGNRSHLGLHLSAETKEKLRLAQKANFAARQTAERELR